MPSIIFGLQRLAHNKDQSTRGFGKFCTKSLHLLIPSELTSAWFQGRKCCYLNFGRFSRINETDSG
jgi:hypothetical protein